MFKNMSKVFFEKDKLGTILRYFPNFHQFVVAFGEKVEYKGYTLCVNPIV